MERQKYTDEQLKADMALIHTVLIRVDGMAQRLKQGCDPASSAASEIDRGMGRMRRQMAMLLSHAAQINEIDKLPEGADPRELAQHGFRIIRLGDDDEGGDGQQH